MSSVLALVMGQNRRLCLGLVVAMTSVGCLECGPDPYASSIVISPEDGVLDGLKPGDPVHFRIQVLTPGGASRDDAKLFLGIGAASQILVDVDPNEVLTLKTSTLLDKGVRVKGLAIHKSKVAPDAPLPFDKLVSAGLMVPPDFGDNKAESFVKTFRLVSGAFDGGPEAGADVQNDASSPDVNLPDAGGNSDIVASEDAS